MRVLLTGNEGYIGAVLTPLLIDAGHDVVGLDSGLFRGCDFGEPPTSIAVLQKDLRDLWPSDLEGFDAVLHLAGLCNDPLSELNPNLTIAINKTASARLARLARAAGVQRFLVSSSCSIYGAAGDSALDENAPLNPVTVYGRCKAELDEEVAQLATNDFSPTFLRNATVYGVSPRLRLDLVLNNLVASAVTTGVVLMKSDGTPWRPIVHVRDVAAAFLAALEAPRDRVHNESFNVGADTENYQIRELADIVAQTVPNCRIEYAEGAGPDPRCYRVNFSKIREALPAFRPVWNARLGALELYNAFLANPLQDDDVSWKFQRLAHVRRLMDSGQIDKQLRMAPVAIGAAQ